jgi:hypothetical protein
MGRKKFSKGQQVSAAFNLFLISAFFYHVFKVVLGQWKAYVINEQQKEERKTEKKNKI